MSGCGCGGAAPAPAQARTRGRRAILPDRIRSAADLDRALAALGGEGIRSGRTAGGGSTGRVYSYDDDTGGAMPTSTQVDQTELPNCDNYYPGGMCDDEDTPLSCSTTWTVQSVVAADTTIVAESKLSASSQSDLELIVQRAMTYFNIPSMSVAVLSPAANTIVGPGNPQWQAPRLIYAAGFTHHPAFVAHGFPDEDPARNSEFTMTSQYVRFRVASISKILTALGVMRLQKLFPNFLIDDHVTIDHGVTFSQSAYADSITSRHLLSHSSGLAREPDPDRWVGHALQRLPVSAQDLLDFAAESSGSTVKELLFYPGKDVSYSSYGMLVLGQVIEAVSGESYESFIRHEVTMRCQMTATRVADPLESANYEATYYANRISCGCECEPDCARTGVDHYPMKSVMSSRYNGSANVLEGHSCIRTTYGGFNHQAHAASSGWVTSVRDLARLMRMFHRCLKGDADWFLTKAEAEEMVTEQFPAAGDSHYGLGWALFEDNTEFGHYGRRCGTTSAIRSGRPGWPNSNDFYPSICWIANTDLSRECRKAITKELYKIAQTATDSGGDLLPS